MSKPVILSYITSTEFSPSPSDDAGAPSAEIRFRTQGYVDNKDSKVNKSQPLPDLKTAIIHEYAFRNSGQVFRDEDWKRLKKIGMSFAELPSFQSCEFVLSPYGHLISAGPRCNAPTP